jgi:hypothetical protein
LPISWVHGLLGWKVTATDELAAADNAVQARQVAAAMMVTERVGKRGDM